MKTLFGYQEERKLKVYRRDNKGRFADPITQRIEKLERESAYYRLKYEQERRKNIAIADIIRYKDEQIYKLKQKQHE